MRYYTTREHARVQIVIFFSSDFYKIKQFCFLLYLLKNPKMHEKSSVNHYGYVCKYSLCWYPPPSIFSETVLCT